MLETFSVSHHRDGGIERGETNRNAAVKNRPVPMKTTNPDHLLNTSAILRRAAGLLILLCLSASLHAQTLLNVDFGVGSRSAKTGFAATGQSTNDFWNLYRHYDPKFAPGMALVADGKLDNLKLADGGDTKISLTVSNAPGVWGNASGDAMYDTFVFAQNGSNVIVTVSGLEPGRYHLYLYGHADPDVTGEQNSVFTLRSGTNTLGPLTQLGSNGWKAATPWQERYQYVVFRDVPVLAGKPVVLEVAPGANGVAVINGMQIISRGTSPPRLFAAAPPRPPSVLTNLLFREVRYDGNVTDNEARFTVDLSVESMTTNEISAPLFEGDVAVMAPDIPKGLRIVSSAKKYRLQATAPGVYNFKLELVARISKAEPWNSISFTGPAAAIASVAAQAAAAGVEMQLLSGTQLGPEQKATSRVQGLLGSDRALALRWQSKTAEVARKSLVTVDTVATAQVTPTVIKFQTQFRYEILQASVPKLTIALPAAHALTKIQGDQIRDWNVKADGARQLLTVEFIKPIEKSYTLTLLTEQPVETTPLTAQVAPPQPLDIERESGSFSLSADDMLAEIDSAAGLRQVNAAAGTLAAYRFYGRPVTLAARLKRIEPLVKVADRVTARLEESRLLVSHALTLNVEKAGIYAVELTPQAGFVVADVRGEGVEDWKAADGKLRVNFSSRLLGTRRLDVQLEQANKTFPDQITVTPLRVTGATNETAQIGAASALGIRLKTAGELTGLREVPVSTLLRSGAGAPPAGSQTAAPAVPASGALAETVAGGAPAPLLAFTADAGDWKLTLAAERLPARVIAEVFNLITIGDGLVGGSATIRYGLINQGVQEFQVKLPAHWKNVEFTGPNIRRKETNAPVLAVGAVPDTNSVLWTITLQDKAWGGYTLVVTYDYQFDPKRAALDLGGAHALNVERETGSLAITTAANLELETKSEEPLRLIDQTELAETDRALITRPVLRAFRYTGDNFKLIAALSRHDELRVLDAVADRTQLTSVLTEEGQMLTQASFMVKNNDKQFQRFKLPAGAKLWGCYVNNEPVKAEQDGEWLLVSLPRGANRDEAFAVDIKYEQKLDSLKDRVLPASIALAAPQTDVPNTYAEWQLYVPPTARLSGFGGNMTVARGTTYGLRDAWKQFTGYYGEVLREHVGVVVVLGGGVILLIAVMGAATRRGGRGVVTVIATFAILALLVGMILPSFTKARSSAQASVSMSQLKQIGLAANMFAAENGGRFPNSFEEMSDQLGSDKVLTDPETGQRMIYVGAGKRTDNPQAIIAYSPNGTAVAYADGSVTRKNSGQLADVLQREANAPAQFTAALSDRQQEQAVRQQQTRTAPATPPQAPVNGPARARLSAIAGKPGEAPETVRRLDGSVEKATSESLLALNEDNSSIHFLHPADPATAKPAQPASGLVVNTYGGFAVGGAGSQILSGDRNLGASFGMVGGVSAADASGLFTPPASGAAHTAAGIRSIRIDIPPTGQLFTFTKVLNVNGAGETLSVKLSAMRVKVFNVARSVLQLLAFVAGLILVWREWHRHPRRSFRLALGLALTLGAVGHLLIAARVLHLAFIAALPVLALLLLGWLAWKFWPRRRKATSPEPEPTAQSSEAGAAPGVPPAIAVIALLLSLAAVNEARAQEGQSPTDNGQSPITNAYSILSANYTGAVHEKVAQFDATIQVSTFVTNQHIALFGEDVAIQQFSTDAKDAKLLRQGRGVSLRLAEAGSATVQLKLVVKLGGDVTKRQLAFAIPPALSSKLVMTIDEGDADVEFPTAIAFKRAPDKTETRVEAILGSGDRVEMFWTPRVKRVAEMAASIFAQNTVLVTFGGGVVNTRATLDYQITQGELRQVKVRLPAGQRLLRVEGEWIRVWELNEEGREQILTVDLLKGVSPGYRLTVETEKVLDKLPATVRVEVPHVMDVIRETGLVGLRGGEELSLSVETFTDLQRVDAAEFAKAAATKADGLLSAYRFLKSGFDLTTRAEAIQPQVEAMVRNAIRIGFEQVSVVAQVDYTIKKAGVFALRLAAPVGYKIEGVTGDKVQQWTERENPRAVEVTLKERTMGQFTLRVALTKAHKELPKTMDLAGVAPLETQKLTGYVSVSSEPGVAVKTTGFDGLTEIPAAQLMDSGAGFQPAAPGILPANQSRGLEAPAAGRMPAPLLAYKFLGTDPQSAAAWKLAVATETVESWVRAEVVNLISVSETLVSGRALIRYDIQNAPVKEFRVKVPAGYTNVEFFGANIRRRDPGAEWRIELQTKVRGTYALTMTWEQPRAAKTNAPVEVAGVETVGTERETGAVVLLAKPPLQVTERTATEQLVKIDARELPDWAGVSATAPTAGAETPVLVYRYLRPGYRLVAEARRFTEAAVLQALVDSARLTTVVADDGQMMTEMTLAIRNNGLQHLEIDLPAGAEVWSAFVAGQPVRPSRRGGKLLLPLERSGADEAPIAVEMTYVSRDKFPRTKGGVKLASPKLDVPMKNARWDLYLPPDYDYAKFEGSMTHEESAAPVVQVYSSTEYLRQESEKKVARQSEVRSSLSKARKGLASGKVSVANEEFGNSKRLNVDGDLEAKRELESLQRDLGRVQSSNLIQAQRAYTYQNVNRFADVDSAQPQGGAGQQAAELLTYDTEAAEQQWGALQKAQEVAVARVQPLRVNLPTRGQRHAFTQVLQTEVNKPMTIEFAASNTKEVGWLKQAVYLAGAFMMLWIFVGAVANRAAQRPQPRPVS